MTGAFARDLERDLSSLFQGGLTPYEFRRWFANALWEAEGSADKDALRFADEIENMVAERSGDHITDAELVEALRVAAAQFSEMPAIVRV